MENRELLENLKDQNTWRLLGLGIITFGVYFAHYIQKQSKVINSKLDDDKISKGFVNTIMIMSYISLALFVPYLLVDEGHPIEKISSLVDKIWGILLIVWGFKARNRVNSLCKLSSDSNNWFHGLWTFLFTALYFNYKVNCMLESNVEQSAEKDAIQNSAF